MTYALTFLAGGIIGFRWAYLRAIRHIEACDQSVARTLRMVVKGTEAGTDMMGSVRRLATELERGGDR